MAQAEADSEKKMKLRYAGTCHLCGAALAARQEAVYERTAKRVRCVECPSAESPAKAVCVSEAEPVPGEPECGVAGASAQREYERRKTLREERVRAKHPKLGGLILALSDEPQTTKSWASGAKGEVLVGARLDELASESIAVLHDRRIPGTRANIDHIVVTPSGVFVIDPKRYVGKRPELRVEGGFFKPRVEKLIVGGRNQTKLVDGVLGQVQRVQSTLADESIPVSGLLCFVDADWPLFGGGFTIRGVRVTWPRKLSKLLVEATGDLTVTEVRDRIAAVFPEA